MKKIIIISLLLIFNQLKSQDTTKNKEIIPSHQGEVLEFIVGFCENKSKYV